MNPIFSFLFGSVAKVVATMIGKWLEMKKTKDLLLARASIEKITALQGGVDTLSGGGMWTRRILAFELVTTWCFILIYHVMHPTVVYQILIPKTPGILLGWIFGAVDQGVVEISAGFLLWLSFNVISMIAGFYFTKIEKGG